MKKTCSEGLFTAYAYYHSLRFLKGFKETHEVTQLITATLDDEVPVSIGKGKTIRTGVNQELDDLRNISGSGKEYLEKMVLQEQEKTGALRSRSRGHGAEGLLRPL